MKKSIVRWLPSNYSYRRLYTQHEDWLDRMEFSRMVQIQSATSTDGEYCSGSVADAGFPFIVSAFTENQTTQNLNLFIWTEAGNFGLDSRHQEIGHPNNL